MLGTGLGVAASDTAAVQVPAFESMVAWWPDQTRNIVVAFPDISFRYEILGSEGAPECQGVSEVLGEIRWLTTGWMPHQYFTRTIPTMYKKALEVEWKWVSVRTYVPCVDYDYESLKCKGKFNQAQTGE
jgi:hypothetical protein